MALTTKLPRSVIEYFALPPSDFVNNRTLAASVAESIAVPDGALYAVFSANADFYANYTTTATIPADVTDGSASELNPTIRKLQTQAGVAIANISVIAPGATQVNVSFYLGPP